MPTVALLLWRFFLADILYHMSGAMVFLYVQLDFTINIKFIIYLLNGSFTQSYFDNSKKTTAIPNLTLEIVSNVVVPLPPLAEQKRIVAALEASLKLVDTIAKDSADLDKALKFLRQKVLDMAMRGLLVEQRQEEGNASDLLEQIRAEKAALIKKGQIKNQERKAFAGNKRRRKAFCYSSQLVLGKAGGAM